MNSEAVYEIYVDVLYGNCVVMNYLILTLTGIFLGRSATRLRKILISMLCAGISLCCLLIPWIPSGLRMILGYGVCELLALIFAFCVKDSQELLRGVICMYLLTFLYGGVLSFLEEKISYLREHGYTMPILIGIGCACGETVRMVHSRLKTEKEHRERLYEVRFLWEDKEYSCIALYDTGNQLYEPLTKNPVCIVEKTVLAPSSEQYEAAVPYHSVGCAGGMLYGVYAKRVRFYVKDENGQVRECGFKERLLLAVSPESVSAKGDYRMILHPDIPLSERES